MTRTGGLTRLVPITGQSHLFQGNEEIIDRQWGGRYGKVRVGGAIREREITESMDVTLGDSGIPQFSKVEIPEGHGLKIGQVMLNLESFIKVEVVSNLANMDGGIEIAVGVPPNHVVSRGDANKVRVADGMKGRLVVLEFKDQ